MCTQQSVVVLFVADILLKICFHLFFSNVFVDNFGEFHFPVKPTSDLKVVDRLSRVRMQILIVR